MILKKENQQLRAQTIESDYERDVDRDVIAAYEGTLQLYDEDLNRICVCETRMPPAATKLKYGKNLQVLHFDPAPPPGACDVSEV